MKILQVQFQNLNSLAGSWIIDFTSPEISGDGIFAITGPTGAGKSTILDAVCLALYGRTPRLENVNKTTNEIMTRQTGECFSEIEFLTSKGKFRCHWSQHRARKTASGELQPQKHEIVDCATNKVIESKIKCVRQKVAEVTGMDFNQFTRSILLAQGEFNTFLKADSDKRSPILEQITGTDIYSRISVKVHEVYREKQAQLKRLSTEIDSFLPLSSSQEEEINSSLSSLADQAGDLDRTIRKNLDILDWHTHLEKLQADLNSREKESAQLELQYKNMAPAREKRSRVEEARKLEPLYLRLLDLRKLQNEETKDLAESKIQLNGLKETLDDLEQKNRHTESQLFAAKKEWEEKNHLFKEVRAKDLEIQHFHAHSINLKEKLNLGLKKITDHQERILVINNDIVQCTTELSALETYQEKNAEDRLLIDELSGIKEQFHTYKQLSERTAASAKTENELQSQINSLEQAAGHKTKQLAFLREELKQNDEQRSQFAEKLNKLLGEHTSRELFRKAAVLQEKIHAAASLSAKCIQLDLLKETMTRNRDHEKELDRCIQTTQIRQQAIDKEVTLNSEACERQQKLEILASKVKNYEQERAQLTDASPCPLCGALDHPYVKENCPEPSEEKEKLRQLNSRLRESRQQQSDIVSKLSRLTAEKKQSQNSSRENKVNLRQLEECIAEEARLLHLEVTEALGDNVAGLTTEMKEEARELLERHTKAESIKEKIDQLNSLRETATARVIEAERILQSSDHNLSTLRARIKETGQDRIKLEKQFADSTMMINESLRRFTNQEISPANLEDVLLELEQKRMAWLQKTDKLQALSSTRFEYESSKKQTAALIENLRQTHQSTSKELSQLNSQLELQRQKRRHIYGDKNPDAEEQRLLAGINGLETQLVSLKKQLDTAQHRRTSLTEKIDTLTGQAARRGRQLDDLNREFLSALQETAIIDEKNFQRYRLSETAFSELCRHLDELNNAMTSNRAFLNSLKKSINTEQDKKITENSRQETEKLLGELQKKQGEQQQKIGALNQQLQDNSRQKQVHAKKIEEFTGQKEESDRWGRLHELIGSADGKKFRNFAQGITFELMLNHANRTLQRMSDRYILVREPSQPLELSIIDNYQAGEIRTIKNLSGGESFLVSMALALGLSSMASKNVQVDSLFLDEGFGTLDEETLQTALDILSSLHQEGKLIGVISHVTGLQERINAQIQVTKGPGGRSSLSGAGVRGGGN